MELEVTRVNAEETVRLEKAKDLVNLLRPVDGFYGVLQCPGSRGDQLYTIDLTAETCTCQDFNQRGRVKGFLCKHLLAAKIKLGLNVEAGEKFTTPEDEYGADTQEANR